MDGLLGFPGGDIKETETAQVALERHLSEQLPGLALAVMKKAVYLSSYSKSTTCRHLYGLQVSIAL